MSQLSNLRKKALRLFKEHEALLVVLGMVGINERKRIDRIKDEIKHRSRRDITNFIQGRKEDIKDVRTHYGAKTKNKEYLNICNIAAERKEAFLLIPKYLIQKKLFASYDRRFPGFDDLPPHANIGIDYGCLRPDRSVIEVFLLEAILYENMCALFNLAKSRFDTLDRKTAPKRETKEFDSLQRATITSAFNFVEAYLNGIAFDYYIENEDKLDNKKKGLLREWDFKKERHQYLSLRDKVLQYPKIVMGLQHPPLHEGNFPELEYFVGRAKLLRDSIVHATPEFDLETFETIKEKVFHETDFGQVERLVDVAIKLVRKIHENIAGTSENLFWLHPRDQNGMFPDTVFD